MTGAESLFHGALLAWGALGSLLWIAASLGAVRVFRRIPRLEDLRPPEPARWPRLSVVVAARDEGETLSPALASLRTQDYPDLELVAVDDRSTDATGAIIDEAAAADSRVVAVHIKELPAGWLGKVHALDQGSRTATGEWILFTDADVHFAPGALRLAVAHAVAAGLDHFTLAPGQENGSLATQMAITAFGGLLMVGSRAHRVGAPGSSAFIGIGAFNLVRRSVLEQSDGFAWLRLELADDMGLGLLLKRAGARARFALGTGVVKLTWYPTLAAMARGLEKNVFPVAAGFRYWLVALEAAALVAYALAPFVGLAVAPVLGGLALATYVLSVLATAPLNRQPVFPALLGPVGLMVVAAFLLRSAWACSRRGGIVWRDTFYPIAELRAGQRVRFAQRRTRSLSSSSAGGGNAPLNL